MYEIPVELSHLYRHWRYHTILPENKQPPSDFNHVLLKEIEQFITERMNIWYKKYSRESKPYTSDDILATFRFCNVYRELDRQTIEIHSLLQDIRDNFKLWLLNVAFARLVCNIETVKDVGLLSFNIKNNQEVMNRLLELPSPRYGTAYIFPISVIQKSQWNTRELFFTQYLPSVIPKVAEIIRSFANVSVLDALDHILPVFGFNLRFHWTEILIDVAYQFPQKIDLYKPFYVGPGAIPTLQSLSSKNYQETLTYLSSIELENFPYLSVEDQPIYLSYENWEGIACEFRKYTNLNAGKGRKRYYRT